MSCRRISRELLERFRFGDLDARSAPHLEHLDLCAVCRTAVGVDRALVHQLQRALRARVADHSPSEGAWEGIRRRALADSPPAGWHQSFFRWARLAPAAAAMAVMVVAVAGARVADRPGAFQGRAVAASWPGLGFQERASNDPDPLHADGWWLRYATPQAGPPRSGLTAYTDPGSEWISRPVSKPSSGLTR